VAFSTYLGQIVLLTATEAKVIAVGMIVAVAALNVLGTRKSANVQNAATAIKVVAILAMSAVLLLSRRSVPSEAVVETSGTLISGFGLAMISVLWAYEGWQYCTFSAGETVDPQRSFPRAFLVGSVSLIVIYVVANLGYMAVLGSAGAAASNSVAAEAMRAAFGPLFAKLIAVVILVSIFSAANGLTLTSPRVYYAMANDGVFFRRLASVHPRFQTPAFAVVAGSAWAAVLAASGTFEQLLTYVVFTGWIFYGLGAAAVFIYRRREPDTPRPYRVPGYPYTSLMFVIAAGALVLNTVVAEPRRALVGLGLVISGAPAYLIWRRHNAGTQALSAPRA
ncbi:MAG TPA: amino acid permease, partial [Terriglobales bacterium]|nr:amino acid permease [Terriglobales bacterium]